MSRDTERELYEALQEVKAERDALGERCHQLETALAYYADGSHSIDGGYAARAALGDTPPRDITASADALWDEQLAEEYHLDSVEPPQPETPEET